VHGEHECRQRHEVDWQRLAVVHSRELIALLDDEVRYMHVSPSHQTLLGYAPEALIGQSALDLVHPDDRDAMRRGLAGGEGVRARLRRADGGWIDAEGSATAIVEHENRRVLVALRDVSERSRGERRRDAQYAVARVLAGTRTLTDAGPAVLAAIGGKLEWQTGALWLVDAEAQVLRCAATWPSGAAAPSAFEAMSRSTTFARGVGLPGRVWTLGAPAWSEDVTADDNFPRREAALRDGLRGGFAFPLVTRGEVHGVLEFFSTEARERDDDLVHAVTALGHQFGQFLDRLQAEDDVRAGEAFKSAVIESALDCVITMDHRGRITEFNPAAERTFGHARADVIGRELAEVVVPPSLRGRHRNGLARYVETGRSEILGARLELLAMRADGSEFPAELTVTRIVLPGPPMFTGYIRDLTEHRRAEEALREAQKMEAVGRLAGGIAHDFNNLLSVIGGFAELGQHSPEARGELAECLSEIAQATEQGAALTRQLLAFSRRQPTETTVLSVNRVIAELDGFLRRALGEELRLVTVFGATRGLVAINRGQLEQVIVNLAVNARDAMAGGGKLTIETDEPQGSVVLRVSDTGCGMDADTQARIFEPFFTTKAPGDGTGLGLSTVYGIVTAAGGQIEVDSEPGRGAAFTIRLPAAAGADAVEDATLPVRAASSATVLLVEDNDSLRAVARRMLADEGYEVLLARTGPDALRLLEAHEAVVDLLVSDIVMPGMRGPELAARLRAANPDLPVLFISGYSDQPPDRDCPDAGFLSKPFKREALLDAVAGLLQRVAAHSDRPISRLPTTGPERRP
jgi:PAS domain S-box-containing protein